MSNNKRMGRKVMRSYIISTISISLVLFMLGVVSYVTLSALSAARSLRESVVVSVEVANDISAESRKALEMMLGDKSVCAGYEYLSKEDKISDEAFRSQFEVDLDLLLGENPLLSSYEVTIDADYSNREGVEMVVDILRSMEGVEYISVPPVDVVERMHNTISQVSIALLLFLALLLFISLLLLSNTIRLAVYSKRYLINTMKLVGATKWYIMRPFLATALGQGAIAGLVAALLIASVVYGVESYAITGVEMLGHGAVAIIIGSVVALGVVITTIFSAFAVNKFVNMRSNKIYLY
ncbi:MAG: permease-like cell division protein FtsX [Alistipes sp.]|nr:permease-like cell division protein FtsX [Alistipes sp.]